MGKKKREELGGESVFLGEKKKNSGRRRVFFRRDLRSEKGLRLPITFFVL